ncbi:MAG: FAD-dependent oxidoreductase [Rhizobiaceae bacterium]|nr:FAD-dependent oxidoreductase [Rhizobiaceae bacterium]
MKIAVIGSGVSGNAAAWALSKTHDVTVFEKRNRIGGHSATVTIDHHGKSIAVDTGFIVYNELNYPLLVKLFEHLKVPVKSSAMTFSVSLDNGKLEWCGSKLKGIFAQPWNLFSISFLSMLREILRFNSLARRDLDSGALCGLTLNEYLQKSAFSNRLKNDYLVPMTSAIWSTPSRKMLEFPAESLIRFMKNHALIQKKRPDWKTVDGGSRNYVERLVRDSNARYRLATEVTCLRRTPHGVELHLADGGIEHFDEVVLATHSDQSLKMIGDASPDERSILGTIKYVTNDVWLHCDPALMPKRKNAWASWNYLGAMSAEDNRDVSVTYWMNKLQGIDPSHPVFVTLNPLLEPRQDKTFGRYAYAHPLFNHDAIAAQEKLPRIQGKNRVWFCGAWTGFGFHEDGLASGLEVARQLGGIIPWEDNHEERKTAGVPISEIPMVEAAE